ncbi:Protein of unknown function [Gryllus bimaculatus]|nr:Protein of unknown function [Gryllus bimaculatus]
MTIVLQHLKKPNQKLDASEFPNALKTSFDTLCKLLRKKPSEERKKILQVLFASTKYDRPDLRHEPIAVQQVERVLVAAANCVHAMDAAQSDDFAARVHQLIARKVHVLWALYAHHHH